MGKSLILMTRLAVIEKNVVMIMEVDNNLLGKPKNYDTYTGVYIVEHSLPPAGRE